MFWNGQLARSTARGVTRSSHLLGNYVMNAREDAQYVVDTIAAYQAEIAEVSGLLRALYWQLEMLAPYCKHPQQLEERERAGVLLGITPPDATTARQVPSDQSQPSSQTPTR
jgi:hypothetical protein